MHPIERLRHVARAEGAGPSLLGREAAHALASFAGDPPALVTACRRLVERHPATGTIWWTAARVLAAGDPGAEAHACATDLAADGTAGFLAADLPGNASVVVVGWPEQAAEALARRADLEVLVADCGGGGNYLARRLRAADVDAVEVADAGVGAAAAACDLVVVEATAAGAGAFAAAPGSRAAAAVAAHAGVPVWLVAGAGRVLPARLWDALVSRLDAAADPWEADVEVVPLDLISTVVGPSGATDPAALARRPDCPVAPELLRPAG